MGDLANEETAQTETQDLSKPKFDTEISNEVHICHPNVDEKSENNKDMEIHSFKKPIIIGPRQKNYAKLKSVSENIKKNIQSNESVMIQPTNEFSETSKPPASLQSSPKDPTLEIPYKEPSWSGIPTDSYKLEVLKSGTILETIDLSNKSYYVVGRLPNCDIPMANPTISRYHAIFQHRIVDDGKIQKGLYVYDLGSTHGTFWNGNQIKPKVFVRLQGGHMVKFGCSQRKFIILAPDHDQEQESELSLTELKILKAHQSKEYELQKLSHKFDNQEPEVMMENEEQGIDWGMGEDADEETDMTENPYAQTASEELFLNDPKKTLRGWFEREGQDLQYQAEDRGNGKFVCWVDLPIDAGKTLRAEATVSGKKKEAVVQCALEACRILDRCGLLRQATHETRKRRARNWEEEDFYDSDEDNFLDRTGAVEKKREQRMRLAGKLKTEVENYDSLLQKYSKITERISSIQNKLKLHNAKKSETNDSNIDALDAYMSSLGSSSLDKLEIRKLKIELINLGKEELQCIKLINIAKPTNLPPFKPHGTIDLKKNTNASVQADKIMELQKQQSSYSSEKFDDGNGERNCTINTSETNCTNYKNESKVDKKNVAKLCDVIEQEFSNTDLKPSTNEQKYEKAGLAKKQKRNTIKLHQKNKKGLAKEVEECSGQQNYNEDAYKDNYDTWVPPENQSGDGKTNLNEKFGY
ncbi:kanadaptin [Trichogramma pretiosum]|uniref:kanadaptin n=1 Tax=Trichogramma pretiosum TaxID=7493 RepID=UPI0006C9D035|nr:kanadaptin [Trichogramma pretiosum]